MEVFVLFCLFLTLRGSRLDSEHLWSQFSPSTLAWIQGLSGFRGKCFTHPAISSALGYGTFNHPLCITDEQLLRYFLFLDRVLSCSPKLSCNCYVVQAVLKFLVIILPLPTRFWDYRHGPTFLDTFYPLLAFCVASFINYILSSVFGNLPLAVCMLCWGPCHARQALHRKLHSSPVVFLPWERLCACRKYFPNISLVFSLLQIFYKWQIYLATF